MTRSALDRILEDKRVRLFRGEYSAPDRAARKAPGGALFVQALLAPGHRLIAELKARSPSAGEILSNADDRIERVARAYRLGGAAALSVVIEEDHFGGRPEWLPRARAASGLPCLMKDFVLEEQQLDFALALGADAVLLIVRALSAEALLRLARGARERGLASVIEAHDAEEIAVAAACEPDVLGVNARDLASFATDVEGLAALAAEIPPGPVRLAESGIRSREEIVRLAAAGYDAFLVGEVLLRSADPAQALSELLR